MRHARFPGGGAGHRIDVDGHGAAAVLPQAFEFAHQFSAPLTVVRAWSPRHGPDDVIIPLLIDWDAVENEQIRTLQTTLAPWIQRYPDVRVTTVVEQVKAGRLLAQHAAGAQLVIVGRSHRGIVRGALLGSTVLNLLHHCPVALMICTPPADSERHDRS